MSANSELLDRLFAGHSIRLNRGILFEQAPSPLPAAFDWDRIEGVMLGLAIGDSLGDPSEATLPARRYKFYGEVRDYLPHRRRLETALPSDDTQLAFWTLDELVIDGAFHPGALARRFTEQPIFGIGSAVREALGNVREETRPWYACGAWSSGNGALMRIAPMLVPHLRATSTELWVDTALSALITHNDPTSTSACLAFVAMLWQLLAMDEAPPPEWWPETHVDLAADLEGEARCTPRGGQYRDYRGRLWRFVGERAPAAWQDGLSALESCDSWYSVAYLLETVPSVLAILMRHADDPEEAIVRAVNDTRDNDTIAAIVGAVVGALHGKQGLPAHRPYRPRTRTSHAPFRGSTPPRRRRARGCGPSARRPSDLARGGGD
jgi:ADP-ribosyl-[dinitrogen reductase] hydrolase